MPRYPQQIPGDEPAVPELDAGFKGINQRVERGQLGMGYLWDAVNVRLDRQQACTRPGCLLPVHYNSPDRVIIGAGVYNDEMGREWMAICEPRQVVLCADGWQPISIVIPAGQELTGSVEVVQCGRELRLLRGPDLDTLTWDGDRLIPQFRELPSPVGRPTFLERQPNASWAVIQADRLWVPISSDEMAWSDILEYNAFDFTLASVRFNSVKDDALVCAVPFQGTQMIVFKTESVHALSGVTGDMSNLRVDPLSAFGCLARRTIAVVGSEIFYLSRGGVQVLKQTDRDALLRADSTPLSYAIPRWMDRVNWAAAQDACACVCGDYYYIALPVDGAERNNAVLVYHLPSKEWHSMDFYGESTAEASIAAAENGIWATQPWAGAAMVLALPLPDIALTRGQAFVKTVLFGRDTPCLVDGSRVIALGHGSMDRLESDKPIQTKISTRGYALGELLSKQVKRVVMQMATRNATVSMQAVTDGVREGQTVMRDVRRNRQKYLRLGKRPFDLSNSDGRYNEPFREDYTWRAGDAVRLGSGIRLGDHQDYERAVPLSRQGRWLACEITSTSGSLRVIAIQAEGLPSSNHARTKS